MQMDITNASYDEVKNVIEKLKCFGMEAQVGRRFGRPVLQTKDAGRQRVIEELDVAGICF